MKLAVACPIYEREWIFDQWADSVEAQTWPDGAEVTTIFGYTRGEGDTLGAICRRFPGSTILHCSDLPAFRNSQRSDEARYTTLATIRNRIMDAALALNADFLLSWDSDLIFPDVLGKLFIDRPVAGALVDMTGEDWLMEEGHGFPSWMWMHERSGALREEDWCPADNPEPFQVGVVMGAVLISRPVIEQARYAYHSLGEDIGFAYSCEAYGFDRWLVPAARGVHVHDKPGEMGGSSEVQADDDRPGRDGLHRGGGGPGAGEEAAADSHR